MKLEVQNWIGKKPDCISLSKKEILNQLEQATNVDTIRQKIKKWLSKIPGKMCLITKPHVQEWLEKLPESFCKLDKTKCYFSSENVSKLPTTLISEKVSTLPTILFDSVSVAKEKTPRKQKQYKDIYEINLEKNCKKRIIYQR